MKLGHLYILSLKLSILSACSVAGRNSTLQSIKNCDPISLHDNPHINRELPSELASCKLDNLTCSLRTFIVKEVDSDPTTPRTTSAEYCLPDQDSLTEFSLLKNQSGCTNLYHSSIVVTAVRDPIYSCAFNSFRSSKNRTAITGQSSTLFAAMELALQFCRQAVQDNKDIQLAAAPEPSKIETDTQKTAPQQPLATGEEGCR